VNRHRENQRDKLRRALEEAPFDARHPGGAGRWLALEAIMRLGIAQHGARLHELRRELKREGRAIENWREWDDRRQCYKSWYRITKLEIGNLKLEEETEVKA
jgi:hypothetical protein